MDIGVVLKMFVTQTFLLICCIRVVFLTEFTHDRKRIGPINLAMAEHSCLQKFSVSENTIIRTQDSRILGAKFLNESDVESREDCLSLCCSTRFCDVAVFQEKGPFPCYLFDCGPSDDFHCKFSTHSYYTSAVLIINRHQLDLGLWSSQHQHETELSHLRTSPEDLSKQILQSKAVSAIDEHADLEKVTTDEAIPTITNPQVTTSPPKSVPKTQPGRRCSRFQFECHSGECIAIYNACDGIPQCKDGSDESHDLSCPQDERSEIGPVQKGSLSHESQGSWRDQASNRRLYKDQDRPIFNHRGNAVDYNNYNNRYANGNSHDYNREDGLGYGGNGKGPGLYDYNQRNIISNGRYGTANQRDGDGRVPLYPTHEFSDYGLVHPARDHQPQQAPPLVHSQQSLLKNIPMEHKLPQQYDQRQELNNPNPMWQGQNSRYMYPIDQKDQKQYSPREQMRPVNDVSERTSPRLNNNNFLQENQMRQNVAVNLGSTKETQIRSHPLMPSSNKQLQNSGESPKIATTTNGNQVLPPNDLSPSTDNKNSASSISSEAAAENQKINVSLPISKSSEEAKKQSQDNSRSSSSDSSDPILVHSLISRLKVDVKELEREEETQKSQVSGALLALSLGVCVTGILIVLAVCRIKGMSRRAHRRRGMKSPLEHDADYLVNGMYL